MTIFLMALFPVTLQKLKSLFHDSKFSFALKSGFDTPIGQLFVGEQTPCTQMSVSKVWSKAFTRLSTESPVRKVDVNADGVIDIVLGYGVDDSIQYALDDHGSVPKCEVDNAGYREMLPCEGGILALDGVTGNTLWQRWTPSIVFSLMCKSDLNKDNQIDCIASGRGGVSCVFKDIRHDRLWKVESLIKIPFLTFVQLVLALNGKNGEILWHLKQNFMSMSSSSFLDLYTINGVRDLDEDSVPDVLAARVEERRTPEQSTISGHITIISGQTGKTIRTIATPNHEEMYVPIQILTQIDGTEMLLIATGGQNSPGGIYLISLNTIMDHSKENKHITIIRSDSSGFMVPAILTDLNEDGVDDIVVSSFNSTVFAFDGQTYSVLWKYIFADSESTSSIAPGHYNGDNITDFMVKYNCGPGFPVYYYSQTQIINGKNGTSLLERMINDSGGANSLLGGISISQTFGGDLFLHWQTQCRGKFDVKDPYQFVPDSEILLQSRADTCMLRYNASTVLKLYAITRHIQSPGAVIFSTDDLLLQLNQTELKQLEKQMAVSPLKHPKLLKKLLNLNDTNANAINNATKTTSPPVVNTPAAVTQVYGTEEKRKPLYKYQSKQGAFEKLKNRKKVMDANRKGILPNLDRVNPNNFEKPIYNEQPNEMDVPLPLPNEMNVENDLINQRKKQLKNYILNNINRAESRPGVDQYGNEMQDALQEPQLQQQQQQSQPQSPPLDMEDYQNYYDDNDRRLNYMVNNNRDVRSDDNSPSEGKNLLVHCIRNFNFSTLLNTFWSFTLCSC